MRISNPHRAMVVAVTVTMLGLAGCSTDEDTTGETTAGKTTTATESEQSPVTTAPQVGSGEGLATTAYVKINEDALQVGDRTVSIDESDPESVLIGGLSASFAWKPAEDSTAFDAIRRAHTVWNNFWLRDNESALTTAVPMSSRDWQDWGDHEQEFRPAVSILSDQHPPDTDTDFSRQVNIDMVTTDGTEGRPGRLIMSLIGLARVHNTDQGWRIDSLRIIDTQLPPLGGENRG